MNLPSPSSPPPAGRGLRAQAVGHYENFPVASLLCPPRLRAPVMAIYHFARTADDIADEGDASPQRRLDDLAAYRADLAAAASGHGDSARWPQVFGPLARAMASHRLPEPLLADLLDAFAQDIAYTRDARRYANRAELMDYCRRSANPVGRLLLHLYGIDDAASLAMSDRICTALQLINFWQDPSVDIPRGRFYFTQADCARFGIDEAALRSLQPTPEAARLVADSCAWARAEMLAGAPLVQRIPGRAGWELRLVVQGGLRILDRIDAIGHHTLASRPTVGARDLPVMLWRAFRMGQSRPTTTAS